MSGYSRVVEEGELSQIATDVGSANPHSGRTDEGFSLSGFGRLGGIDEFEVFRGDQLKGFHKVGQGGLGPFRKLVWNGVENEP